LNGIPTSGNREQEARDALMGMCAIAPVAIYNRVAYSDALNDGRAVNEYDPKGKAAKEIMALYRWCMK
jgi:chromosome partitioning protein